MKILPFRSGPRCRPTCARVATFVLAAVVTTFQIVAAIEQTVESDSRSETKTIRITADKLIADIDAAEIDFLGNVKARQAGVVITADRLKIIYDPDAVANAKSFPKSGDIRKIIAGGHVKIVDENLVAEADKAEYTIISAILVLIGDPARVTRNGHLITGSKFILQRSDGTLTVEARGKNRVRAIFQP